MPANRRYLYSSTAIAVVALLLIAAIWSVSIERVRHEREAALGNARDGNRNIGSVLEEHTRGVLSTLNQGLAFVRLAYIRDGTRVPLLQVLQDASINRGMIGSIEIADADGRIVTSSQPAAGNAGIDPAIVRALAADDTDAPFVGLPRQDPDGTWRAPFARRLMQPDGSFGGAVVAWFDPMELGNVYRRTSLGDEDVILIVHRDGSALIRRSGDRVSIGEDYRDAPLMKAARDMPAGSLVTRGRVDGITRILDYKSMQDYPLVLAVGMSETPVLERYRTKAREYYGMALFASVAIALLAFVLMRALAKQRQSLENLMSNEKRFRATFDQAFVGMAQASPDGRILRVNRKMCDMLGYDEAGIHGRTLESFVLPADRDVPRRDGAAAQLRLLRRDGRIVWADVTSTTVRDTAGGVDCVVTVVQDITEFKRIDRMKSEFVSTVSHELRTPLTSIRGSLGLVAGGVAGVLPEAARNLVDIAKTNCERLIRLINDILDSEKIESGKMTFVSSELEMRELLSAAIVANQGFADQHRVALRLHAPAQPVRVMADADRLTQVVTNLLSNAIKFSPENSAVEVTLSEAAGRARVEVQDRGPGIPREFRDRIFRKFSQADSSDSRARGGTGLGLNISRAIIERSGGTLAFTSEVGQGSTFHFDLPAIGPRAVTTAPAARARPLVLVVEDHPEIARLITTMLDKAGFETELARTAAEARACVARRHHAAMTVDLKLPGVDGVAFIRGLRREPATREVPVIVVSAMADEGRIQLNGEAHAVAEWLARPIDENRLVRAVRKAVSGEEPQRPRILHVEDDPDIQRVAAAIAQGIFHFEFAGTVAEARSALARWHFDLVLLDLRLPDGSGWDVMPDIEAQDPAPPVVVFSVDDVPAAARSRVAAVLTKSDTSNERLVATIRQVLAGASEPARMRS
jgi:PAS domain S-box-containing protein